MTVVSHYVRILVVLCLVGWLPACGARPVTTDQALIQASHPHDPHAFTQGLLISDGTLFESTGQYGHSSVRRVNLETGQIEQITHLPDYYFGEGLALVGARLYQLTWKAGVALVYDRDSLERVGRFNYSGQGWGLTYDGQDLIMSNGSATLKRIDPNDFSVIDTIDVREEDRPVERLNELEYINGEIWANIWFADRIVRIDPASGQVIGSLDARALKASLPAGGSPDVLNGIAWDASTRKLYLTGKYWPRLFKITLASGDTHAAAQQP